MKPAARRNSHSVPDEKQSMKFLMEKMGLSRKEIEEISNKYGVSASQLIEVMQYSRYQFVQIETEPGQCKPCKSFGRINTLNLFKL